MRRAGALRHPITIFCCLALATLCGTGCGGNGKPASGDPGLTFEQLADTAGLANGEPIVQGFDAYRMAGGSLRVKARVRLPEGTRVQVALKSKEKGVSLAMTQAVVQAGEIETPPMMAASGPLPVAPYRIELSAQFTPAWQSAEVLRATDDGKSLRGPGITRTRIGGAMFWMVEETTR
jgi:hypothetical protein